MEQNNNSNPNQQGAYQQYPAPQPEMQGPPRPTNMPSKFQPVTLDNDGPIEFEDDLAGAGQGNIGNVGNIGNGGYQAPVNNGYTPVQGYAQGNTGYQAPVNNYQQDPNYGYAQGQPQNSINQQGQGNNNGNQYQQQQQPQKSSLTEKALALFYKVLNKTTEILEKYAPMADPSWHNKMLAFIIISCVVCFFLDSTVATTTIVFAMFFLKLAKDQYNANNTEFAMLIRTAIALMLVWALVTSIISILIALFNLFLSGLLVKLRYAALFS